MGGTGGFTPNFLYFHFSYDYWGGGDSRNSHSLPTFFVYFLSKIIIDNSCESAAFYQLCYERNERFAERQLNSRNDN